MPRLLRALPALLLAAGLTTAAPPRDKPAPADDKLLSKLPHPEAGKAVEVTVAEFDKPAADGSLAGPPKATKKESVKVPAKGPWRLGADGWFDADGFNLTTIEKTSGLLQLRAAPGGPGAVPMQASAEPRDVVTHIDGVAVTSAEAFWFALDRAKDKADVAVVVRDGATGTNFLQYLSLTKAKE